MLKMLKMLKIEKDHNEKTNLIKNAWISKIQEKIYFSYCKFKE